MRAVFLDRDGVIIKSAGLVTKKEEVEFETAVPEAIKIFNGLGLKVIIVTNQPQVARGTISEEGVKEINNHMVDALIKNGAFIDDVYFCPHHPEQHDDVPDHAKKYRVECRCRKPNPGMLLDAARKHSIDLEKSFMIGDKTSDVMAGRNAGTMTIIVKTGHAGLDKKHDVKADHECDTLLDAAKLIRNSVKTSVIILAGGRGERLIPLTNDMPKPMIDINGKPVLRYHLDLLKKHGLRDVAICGSYLVEKIKAYFGSGESLRMHISYPEEITPLGTGGAIRNAMQQTGTEEVLVLNGDVVTNMDLTSLLNFHFSHGGIVTVVLRSSDHPIDSDIVRTNDKNEVVEYIGRGQDMLKTANTGIMVLRKDIMKYIPAGVSNIEKDVLFKMLRQEKVYGYTSNDYIKDMGTMERLEKVRQEFLGI